MNESNVTSGQDDTKLECPLCMLYPRERTSPPKVKIATVSDKALWEHAVTEAILNLGGRAPLVEVLGEVSRLSKDRFALNMNRRWREHALQALVSLNGVVSKTKIWLDPEPIDES